MTNCKKCEKEIIKSGAKMKTAKEIIKKKIDRIKKSLMIGKMLESQAGKGAFDDIDEKEIFCIEILEEILKELDAPDLNSRSSNEDSINKDLTATQQVATPKSATQTSLNPDIKRK